MQSAWRDLPPDYNPPGPVISPKLTNPPFACHPVRPSSLVRKRHVQTSTAADGAGRRKIGTKLVNGAHDLVFKAVHKRCLIYNVCWEDPRIDRQILNLDDDSRVVVLTSAGCNTLDYLLDSPAEIHAVDVNPRQNALLHLKLALIERGDFADLFNMFWGTVRTRRSARSHRAARHSLPAYAQAFWDEKIDYFDNTSRKKSFYYYGTSGRSPDSEPLSAECRSQAAFTAARSAGRPDPGRTAGHLPTDRVGAVGPLHLLAGQATDDHGHAGSAPAADPADQHPVPRWDGGLRQRQAAAYVLTEVLIQDNYFWRVYLTGSYTPDCCPNYLKPENFEQLHANVGRVRTHNATVSHFLKEHPGAYSHFVLLDHQDWLAWHKPEALREEWN